MLPCRESRDASQSPTLDRPCQKWTTTTRTLTSQKTKNANSTRRQFLRTFFLLFCTLIGWRKRIHKKVFWTYVPPNSQAQKNNGNFRSESEEESEDDFDQENDTDNESNRSSTDQNTWSAAQALLNLGQKSAQQPNQVPVKVCALFFIGVIAFNLKVKLFQSYTKYDTLFI